MKTYDVPVQLSFTVTVKRIEAISYEEARKLAIEAVDKFFRQDDAIYFDRDDVAYDPVDMDKDGLYDIAISVDSNYKVE